MRGVGDALGYEAMSLYKHVAGKRALLDLVIDRVASEMQPPEPSGPWEDRLRHIAGEWRQMALAHPHVFPLLAAGPPPSPASLVPVIDATLGALRDATVDDEATIGHFWAFLSYTTGALVAECAATVGAVSPSLSAPGTVDPDAYPHLAALRPALAACDFAVEYQRGLEILIASAAHRGAN
jgi:TetR/AcrR family tetracycline transcriptional repressor